jgi:hypothetical protein
VRTAAKLLAALVLVVVAAGGWLAWRLAQRPISLDALTPRIEKALNASDAALRVSVGATELAWAGWRRGVYLRARDVRITGPDGAVVANIPALALRLALRALLHRQLAFRRIELLSPLLRLVREPDGRFGLGLGAGTEARPENPVAHDALEALLTSSDRADLPMAYLRRVEVGDGEVVVEDRGSGVLLRAPRIHLVLSRHAGGLAATLSGDVTVGNQVIPIESTARLQAEPRALDAQLAFRGVNPAAVAMQLAANPAAPLVVQHPDLVKQLAGITVDLAGSIAVHLDGTLHPTTATLDLTGAGGSVTVPGTQAQRWDLKGLRLAAHFDAAADQALIEKLEVDFAGPSLVASARLKGLSGPGTLTVDAALTGLPVDELGRYWPEGAAAGARQWLTTNLSHGRVNNAAVHLSGTFGTPLLPASAAPASRPPSSFVLNELNGSVAFTGLTVRYVPTMPAVTDVAGGGTFTADAWALRVNRGVVQRLRVGPSTVTISKITAKEPTRIAIAADVDGPLADALEVLDAEPLGFAKEIGVAPSSVAGDMRAHVGFDFALGGEIGLDNLGLAVSAQLERVDVPHIIQGWSVAGGDLTVEVDGADLDLRGRARLEGTPLDVEWHEAFAPRAAVRRRVTVKGQIDSAGRAAIGFDLAPWLDGPVGVDMRLTQPNLATGRIDLRLDLAPAHIEVTQLDVRKPPGTAGRAEGTLRLTKGAVTAVDPFEVSMPSCEIQGRAARSGERWSTIDATGTLGAARADVALPGGFTLSVRPAGGVESFSLVSNDVATLFRAVGLFGDGRGGHLDAGGTVDLFHAAHTFDSHVEITDFTVTHAPTLARILTLGSLSGIREMLFSQGVKFSRISARLSGNTSINDISDLVAVGDSLGVAADGRIDHSNNLVNLSGSIVPAYYGVNTTLGKVPVLRDLFAGKGGLGILGIDFTVTGALAQPDVSVHPLQSLTPNVVRRFTDLFRREPSGKKGAAGRKWW